jgi:predicted Rossmann-fold nucleotide-binding protein
MKRITVFCGSSAGIDSTSSQAALLGQTLAKHKIELVYGGAMLDL